MPIYQLTDQLVFPDPNLANDSGIIAVGGDLSPQRLILAYRNGIFPWYNEGEPITWWSPDPRMVLYPNELQVSKSMQKILRQKKFRITIDQDFKFIIEACKRQTRTGQQGTWITTEMVKAYIKLFELGHAHSVEVWQDNQIVGGLYGIAIGKCFCGESMFSKVSNASKAGFITFVGRLISMGFGLIDCQIYTSHLASLGAREIPRSLFLQNLRMLDS